MDAICAICSRDLAAEETAALTTCGHVFHYDCLQLHTRTMYSSCSTCHTRCTADTILKLHFNRPGANGSLVRDQESRTIADDYRRLANELQSTVNSLREENNRLRSENESWGVLSTEWDEARQRFEDEADRLSQRLASVSRVNVARGENDAEVNVIDVTISDDEVERRRGQLHRLQSETIVPSARQLHFLPPIIGE